MSLWTPYVQEYALDLSNKITKNEQDIPAALESPPLGATSPTYLNFEYRQCAISQVQQCIPINQCVPVNQISPYYVSYTHTPPLYKCDEIPPNAALSPPESVELYDAESLCNDAEYLEFEKDALRVMAEKNGGTLLGHNPKMRRAIQTNEAADDTYRKQRQRNNFAAKQSRDRRKMREVRLSLQTTYLKKKVAELKALLAADVCSRCRSRFHTC
ncbi:hepatic leukemia factor-like [Achroia grisella]|uniref:hepatic leukemia factor-like n=1 Tax=Achroia grisella TaxID=688607 RepID=UPI0027D20159|nr:hepatic leukemia factor-like [Achroia grisella]